MADGQVIYEIRGDDNNLDKDLNKSNEKAKKAADKVNESAKKAAKAVGAAFVAAGAASIKFGTDFEQSFANASTMFGDTAVNTDELKAKILSMSDATGIAATDFNDGLYNALSAGIPVTEDMAGATGFLEKCSHLAKGGFTDLTSAIDVSTSILNAYHMSVEDTDKVQKILMQTQNKGKTTIAELSSCISNCVPTASSMNVSFEQVGAALATMTAQGVPTSQATTQLNQLMAELGKQGTKASDILKNQTGKSFQQLMSEGKPLSDVLNLMKTNLSDNANAISNLLGKTNEATGQYYTFDEACTKLGLSSSDVNNELIDMFGSLEAGKAALSMSGENAKTYTDDLAAMSTETDVVNDAFKKVTNTSGAKFGEALNNLKNIGIELYQNFLQPLVVWLSDALTWMGEHKTLMGVIAIVLGTLTVAIILFNTYLQISSAITTIATAANTAFGASLTAALGPIALVVAAIGAIIAIIVICVKHWDTIKECCQKVWDKIVEIFSAIVDWLRNFFVTAFDNVVGVVKSIFGSIGDFFSGQWQRIKDIFHNIIDFIKNVFTGNWSGAWENIKNIFGNIWEGMKAIFKAPINWIIDGINFFLKGINKIKVPDFVPGIGGKGFHIDLIPRLKKGKSFVPSDYYPAYLDYGERVLTQQENAQFNALGGLTGMQSALSRMSAPSSPVVVMSGGSNQIADIINYDKLAAAMAHAPINMDGILVTKAIATPMSKELAWRSK